MHNRAGRGAVSFGFEAVDLDCRSAYMFDDENRAVVVEASTSTPCAQSASAFFSCSATANGSPSMARTRRVPANDVFSRGDRLVVILRAIATISIVVVTTSSWSCSPRPTAEDRQRLQTLQKKDGDRYDFKLEEDTYIDATNRVFGTVDQTEATSLHRDFWFSGDRERQDTNYVDLNFTIGTAAFSFNCSGMAVVSSIPITTNQIGFTRPSPPPRP